MADLHSYSPEAVITSNLQELDARLSRITEQELAHLRELAREIAEDADFTPEFLASLSEHRFTDATTEGNCLSENLPAIQARRSCESVWRSVLLCREIRRYLSDKEQPSPDMLFGDPEEFFESAVNHIVYQQNSYADDAYLRFCTLLESPRATYAKSFEEVCTRVYNRECEYGILPIETSQEGRLNGFWNLIARYELKLAAICDVSTTNQNQTTRFALLRRAPIFLSSKQLANRFFECTVPLRSPRNAFDVLYAAETCGLTLSKLHSEDHFAADCPPASLRLVFRTNDGDLETFLLYLFLEQPGHSFIGFYPYLQH